MLFKSRSCCNKTVEAKLRMFLQLFDSDLIVLKYIHYTLFLNSRCRLKVRENVSIIDFDFLKQEAIPQ